MKQHVSLQTFFEINVDANIHTFCNIHCFLNFHYTMSYRDELCADFFIADESLFTVEIRGDQDEI